MSLWYRFYLLAALAGLTFGSGVVFAQAGPLPIPVHISAGAVVPTGLQSVVTFDARGIGGAANAGYYSRPVLVANNTLAGLANGLVRRSVPVAGLLAAIGGAGWVIDALTKQVMTPASGAVPPVAGTGAWCATGWGSPAVSVMCGPSLASFVGRNTGWSGGPFMVTGTTLQDATFGRLVINNGAVGGMTVQAVGYNPVTHRWLDAVPAAPVPALDLANLLKNNPALAAQALRNADGSVNRNPDVMAAAQALATSLQSATSPVPDPVGQWDTGAQAGPSAGTAPAPAALEFPNFCAWASKVCDAIDWFRDDADPGIDEPIVDIPVSMSGTTYVSGLGGGSCPAPFSATVFMGAELVIPLDFLCQLAVYIRPIVLAAAALMGLFIVGGFGRAS